MLVAFAASACGAHGSTSNERETLLASGLGAGPLAIYTVRGDFLGAPDVETLRLSSRGGVRDVERSAADGSVVGAGVAIPDGPRFYAAFGPRAASVLLAVYRRSDSAVVGLVAYGGRGLAGVEAWNAGDRGPEPFVGRFDVDGHDPLTGEPYEGTVEVQREGDLYRVRWSLPGGEREGVGFVDGEVLAVVAPDEVGVPSAGARMGSGDRALGAYGSDGEAIVGSVLYLPDGGSPRRAHERLERAASSPPSAVRP